MDGSGKSAKWAVTGVEHCRCALEQGCSPPNAAIAVMSLSGTSTGSFSASSSPEGLLSPYFTGTLLTSDGGLKTLSPHVYITFAVIWSCLP